MSKHVFSVLSRVLIRNITVSIFVTCEFPNSSLAELLDRYGEFNHEHIRHLRLKEEGLQHIENGVRVVTFTQIDRPIPHTVIYRGTPLGFRYTGQPRLYFKCASPDHVVRNCPKKLPPPETELNDEPEPLAREQITPDGTLTQRTQMPTQKMTTKNQIWKPLKPPAPRQKSNLKTLTPSQNRAQSTHVSLLHRHQIMNNHQLNSLRHHKTCLRTLHLNSSLLPLKPVKPSLLRKPPHHSKHRTNRQDRGRKNSWRG